MSLVKWRLVARSGLLISIALLSCLILLTGQSWASDDANTFQGKTIRNIVIVINEVFEGQNLNTLYETANNLKISTRKEIIQQELLFSSGDSYDEFRVRESERILRSFRYLREVNITGVADGDEVDIFVNVQDTWTLIPQLSFSSGDGRDRQSVGLAESNLFGFGNRLEVLYQEDDGEESIKTVYDDFRFWGTPYAVVAGLFETNSGERFFGNVSRPLRSLVEKAGWSLNADRSDDIERLYANGDERFIYREIRTDLGYRYTVSDGSPESLIQRYSFGYDYRDQSFESATLEDFDDINLDPDLVSRDPGLLASNRRFSGPVLSYSSTEADFISMNYIDRFERVQDYNLGNKYRISTLFAPEALGSRNDAILVNGSWTRGHSFSNSSFLRGNISLETRLVDDSLENSIGSLDLRYYKVLGQLNAGNTFLGRHTIAASLRFDYAEELDLDKEFLTGGDNALRGYDARSFTGDKRLILNLEDRIHLVEDAFKLISIGAVAFIDAGGSTFDSLGNLITNDFYSDIGVGLRLAFPRSTGSRVLRFDVALPLREGPDGSGLFEPRLIVSGGQLFNSRLRSENRGLRDTTVAPGL